MKEETSVKFIGSRTINTVDYILFAVAWLATSQLYAQEVSNFGGNLESIPIKSLVYVGVLAFLGGLASTLQKFSNPNIQVYKVWVEIMKDLVISIVAGILAFFLAEQAKSPVMLEASLITVSGWAGSKYLDALAGRLLNRVIPSIDSRGGPTGE